jgi:DNA-binding MurR/RpiR family transcriptional regulator
MLARLSTVPFETAASLAAKVEVSEPTVGRFCRSLGYASFKDLKNHLKQDLGEKPWLISDRLAEFQSRAADANSHLQRSLALEIEAVVAVYELAHTAEWARVVRRLASVSAVYVTGFQAERGMAAILVHQLQYLRDGVRLLDLTAGCFTELLASNTRESALIVFAARPYSRMTRLLAQDARDAGIPVTLITDPFCDWGHELADEMLVVPTEFSHFWESTAQMASLANLLVNDVLIERGPRVEQRMDELTRLYSRYTGFVGDAEGPVTGIGKS